MELIEGKKLSDKASKLLIEHTTTKDRIESVRDTEITLDIVNNVIHQRQNAKEKHAAFLGYLNKVAKRNVRTKIKELKTAI